jgi:hypothetical protein
MSSVVEAVVDPIVETVESIASPVVQAVGDVGQVAANVIETAAKTVSNTAQAIINDPIKALPLIATAIVAPELAPLLEVSTPVAGAIINTGMALANGADPTQIAENFATSMATSSLGITTGTSVTDRMLVGGVNAALNGQDVSTGVGTALGNYAISSATNAAVGPSSSNQAAVHDYSTPAPTDTQTAGFSPDELKAINQGQIDAASSGPSPYAPTASTTTSDQPQPLVTVTSAPDQTDTKPTAPPVDAFEDPNSPTGFSNNNGEPVNQDGSSYSPLASATQGKSVEQLNQDLTDGKITAEQFNAAYKTAQAPTSLQEYKDSRIDGGLPMEDKSMGEYQDPKGALPTEGASKESTNNFSGVLGTTTNSDGHVVSTFDDGSTLTYDPKSGEVVDFTEATDTDTQDSNGTKGGLSIGLGKASTQAKSLRKAPTTQPSTTSSNSGLSSIAGSYSSNLTPTTSSGNPEYSLFGETAPQEGMASGGAVQHMATGSTPDTSAQGVYDLSTTASSPFLGGGNQSIMALKPQVIKGKINYALPGYPFGQEWKLAAAGGAIENAPEGHKPEFFSEGGLNSLQHTYLKGGGDGTSDSIPAMLANGEFVIPADVVSSLGNGSSDSGAKVLDEFLKTIREHKRKADPKKLPPDSKGVKGYLLEAKKKVKK